MNVRFNIEYRTVFGESLVLNVIDSKDRQPVTRFDMSTVDGCHWMYELTDDFAGIRVVEYYYTVNRNGATYREEWHVIPHRLQIAGKKLNQYQVFDFWKDIPEDTYLYSTAFTDCLAKHSAVSLLPTDNAPAVMCLKVRAPQLGDGERLVLAGDDLSLGCWNLDKAVAMCEHQPNEWMAVIDVTHLQHPVIAFKFVILKENASPIWEEGDNRTMALPYFQAGDCLSYELPQPIFAHELERFAGTLVPVFSLRSRTSFGVGDFGDLKKMIDWVSTTGQRVLQILPINDTTLTHTWTDSYPYSCISIFALHPQYADLNALPPLKSEAQRKQFEALRKELNALSQIDYERVNQAKSDYLQLLFMQEGKEMMKSAGFKAFFQETQQWLVPYAQYSYLRDKYATADYTQWPDHNVWDEDDRKALSSSRTKAYQHVAFHYFVQYILHTQMEDAHRYARQKGVVLKGDIPIGVNRHGCDAWMEPRYFNLNGQAGAPPDDFSVNGQNWGFPTYNWDEMLKDDCQWWVRRFSNMAHYFDAYRIDHVLGFFRIWEIPIDAVHGLLGQFSPALSMTREEIESYGLHFQDELFLEPFIMDWVLERMFGEKAQMVRETYLEPTHDGRYRMREEFNTQRKVEAYFARLVENVRVDTSLLPEAAKAQITELENLRDGLYALISDVLFVRDHKDPERFHPRIAVQSDFIYESLYDSDKYIFNKLYNDYFYRRNNQFWYQEAMKKMPRLIDATRMLVCAEDLGMVPDCVPWVMNELRILSLELQSMPKDPSTRFGHIEINPYRSVCTISSHDMPTLRQWWDEDNERTQAYYHTALGYEGDAPHPLSGYMAQDIIGRHLACPSMLCILSIQDWMAMDEQLRLPDANAERINIPANPKHYWRYRMHVNIEDLMQNVSFNHQVGDMIARTGR